MPARLLPLALAIAAASCIPSGPEDCPSAGLDEPSHELRPGGLLAHVAYPAQVCAGEPIEVKVETGGVSAAGLGGPGGSDAVLAAAAIIVHVDVPEGRWRLAGG